MSAVRQARPVAAGLEAFRTERANGASEDEAAEAALHVALLAAGRPVPGTPRKNRADRREGRR